MEELAFMVKQRWPEVPVIVTTGYGSEVGIICLKALHFTEAMGYRFDGAHRQRIDGAVVS